MDIGRVLIGLGLLAWGFVLLATPRWHTSSDERIRSMARSNWWLDRHLGARGKTQEEWFPVWIRRYKWFSKWVWTPLVVVWMLAACLYLVRAILA